MEALAARSACSMRPTSGQMRSSGRGEQGKPHAPSPGSAPARRPSQSRSLLRSSSFADSAPSPAFPPPPPPPREPYFDAERATLLSSLVGPSAVSGPPACGPSCLAPRAEPAESRSSRGANEEPPNASTEHGYHGIGLIEPLPGVPWWGVAGPHRNACSASAAEDLLDAAGSGSGWSTEARISKVFKGPDHEQRDLQEIPGSPRGLNATEWNEAEKQQLLLGSDALGSYPRRRSPASGVGWGNCAGGFVRSGQQNISGGCSELRATRQARGGWAADVSFRDTTEAQSCPLPTASHHRPQECARPSQALSEGPVMAQMISMPTLAPTDDDSDSASSASSQLSLGAPWALNSRGHGEGACWRLTQPSAVY